MSSFLDANMIPNELSGGVLFVFIEAAWKAFSGVLWVIVDDRLDYHFTHLIFAWSLGILWAHSLLCEAVGEAGRDVYCAGLSVHSCGWSWPWFATGIFW